MRGGWARGRRWDGQGVSGRSRSGRWSVRESEKGVSGERARGERRFDEEGKATFTLMYSGDSLERVAYSTTPPQILYGLTRGGGTVPLFLVLSLFRRHSSFPPLDLS